MKKETMKLWFENYIYYYKWHTIIALFLAVTIGICMYQLFTREDYDLYIMYAGPDNIAIQDKPVMVSAIKSVLRDDLRSDDLSATIVDVVYVNDELAAKYKSNGLYFSATENLSASKRIDSEIMGGDCLLYILDKQEYESIRDAGGFQKLNDFLGYLPNNAYDEYGVRLGDTNFGKYFSVFCDSADLIMCIRSETYLSKFKKNKDTQEKYELHYKVFEDIISFEIPETAN